jgi:hypothetical protein
MSSVLLTVGTYEEGFDAKRSRSKKNSQVVLRLTVQVAREEAADIIDEFREVIEGDVTFEVPQSSLPIKGIVQSNRKIAGSRVKKWVAVTAGD